MEVPEPETRRAGRAWPRPPERRPTRPTIGMPAATSRRRPPVRASRRGPQHASGCGIARDAAADACRALDRVTSAAAGALCERRARRAARDRAQADDPGSGAGDHQRHRGGGGPAEPADRRGVRDRQPLCGLNQVDRVRRHGGRAAAPQPEPCRDREQRGDLAHEPRLLEQRLVDAGQLRVAPARLAVREVARDQPALLEPERAQRQSIALIHHRADAFAAAAADRGPRIPRRDVAARGKAWTRRPPATCPARFRSAHRRALPAPASRSPCGGSPTVLGTRRAGRSASACSRSRSPGSALGPSLGLPPIRSSSRWSGTSPTRRARRNSSMQAFLAIRRATA